MRKSRLFIVSILTTLLLGCATSHRPLSGLYYGYNNSHHSIALAFDPAYPTKVALRKRFNNVKTYSMIDVTYSANSVHIHSKTHPMTLMISDNRHRLTCPSCDGKQMPKVYEISLAQGEHFIGRMAAIAFQEIMERSPQK